MISYNQLINCSGGFWEAMGSRDAAPGAAASSCDRLPIEVPAENPPHDSSTGRCPKRSGSETEHPPLITPEQVGPPRGPPELTPVKVTKLPGSNLAELAMSEKLLEQEKQSPEARPSSPSPKSRRTRVFSADLEYRPASASSSENNRKPRHRAPSHSPRNQKARISSRNPKAKTSSRNPKARTSSSSSRNPKARTSSSSSRNRKTRTSSSSSRNRKTRTSSSSSGNRKAKASLRSRSPKVKQNAFLDSWHHRMRYL